MRYACFCLISLLPSTGCSHLIMHAGKDVSELEDRKAVRDKFGAPDEVVETEHGCTETYRTHWKISEPFRANSNGEYWLFTFGLIEFAQFPIEMYRLGYRTIAGQELKFCYDGSRKVVGVSLDGDRFAIIPGGNWPTETSQSVTAKESTAIFPDPDASTSTRFESLLHKAQTGNSPPIATPPDIVWRSGRSTGTIESGTREEHWTDED